MSRQRVDWKTVVKRLVQAHLEQGVAGISLSGSSPMHDPTTQKLVNLTPDQDVYSVKGHELTQRKVRGWLWEERRRRRLNRRTGMLWSVYDAVNDLSHVGVGAVTSVAVADRLERMRESQYAQVE